MPQTLLNSAIATCGGAKTATAAWQTVTVANMVVNQKCNVLISVGARHLLWFCFQAPIGKRVEIQFTKLLLPCFVYASGVKATCQSFVEVKTTLNEAAGKRYCCNAPVGSIV